ncbi:MAG: BcepIL02 gp45 [Alphaproteobacteria bacterium]|jgi:hypothetical protein|nr:BcepIL02 gp45 [Alphaproteobacteria bacterium]
MTERQPAIDLSRQQFSRTSGDLAVIGTWLWNEDQETHEPALVIINALNPRAFKPCVVALSAAYKYDDARYCAQVAGALAGLTGSDSMQTAHKIALLIEDSLNDLLNMPPNPVDAVVVADATVAADGRKRSLEIVDYVPQQQV